MPEVGIAHSWIHGESHTTDAEVTAWNTRYGSYDEHVIKSILGARVMGTWQVEDLRVTPAMGVRWEQALNDNEIAISQSLPGTGSYRVAEDLDDTSILTDVSLLLSRENVSAEIRIVHEENGDYSSNGGSVTFRYGF